MKDFKRVHLIGIGGSGLSAIAVVLLGRGMRVSGSDRQLSPLGERVQAAGGQVSIGHRAENILGADLIVVSSAIPEQNVELLAARQAGIPVMKRSDFLGLLTSGYRVLAVAGTHGKTTTTAMLAWVLAFCDYDPSYIIGGIAANLGNNAHHGTGAFFVIEADEYDYMFLGLNPEIAIITNIEHDHPDCYPTPQDFYQAFTDFATHILPHGTLLACAEDPGSARLLRDKAGSAYQALAYGLQSEHSAYQATDLALNATGSYSFRAMLPGVPEGVRVDLQVPGMHNVLNALAVLAAAERLGVDPQQASIALAAFRGTGRRFELRGQELGITVIDDYAHHPTEIQATLAAARGRYPRHALWAVWQPHTYSRTRLLQSAFAGAFTQADHVLVTEIYAARETPPADGYTSRQVVTNMQHPDVHYVADLAEAQAYLIEQIAAPAVVLVLSAGDADLLSGNLLDELRDQLHGLPAGR